MFLIIKEDGELEQVFLLSPQLLEAYEEGIISIVKFEGERFAYKTPDGWADVEELS